MKLRMCSSSAATTTDTLLLSPLGVLSFSQICVFEYGLYRVGGGVVKKLDLDDPGYCVGEGGCFLANRFSLWKVWVRCWSLTAWNIW